MALRPARLLPPKRLSTPRSARRPLDDEPGPATRRSGTYRDGTHTRWPDPASRTQHRAHATTTRTPVLLANASACIGHNGTSRTPRRSGRRTLEDAGVGHRGPVVRCARNGASRMPSRSMTEWYRTRNSDIASPGTARRQERRFLDAPAARSLRIRGRVLDSCNRSCSVSGSSASATCSTIRLLMGIRLPDDAGLVDRSGDRPH